MHILKSLTIFVASLFVGSFLFVSAIYIKEKIVETQ